MTYRVSPLLPTPPADGQDDERPEYEPGVPKRGAVIGLVLLAPVWFSVWILLQLCGDSEPTGCTTRRASAIGVATGCTIVIAVAVIAGLVIGRRRPTTGVQIVWLTVLVELMAIAPVAYLYGAWLL